MGPGRDDSVPHRSESAEEEVFVQDPDRPPPCSSIQGLIVSIKCYWYLGSLKG